MATITDKEFATMAEMAGKWMKVNVLDGAKDGISTYFGNRRTTGNSNRDDRLWVYGRQGQECRRCGGVIEMRKQGVQARSTYWCPGVSALDPGAGASERGHRSANKPSYWADAGGPAAEGRAGRLLAGRAA